MHSKWLDNFSHMWANGTAATKLDQAFYDCLWTGVALHEYMTPDRETQPCIPIGDGEDATTKLPSFCDVAVQKILLDLMKQLAKDTKSGTRLPLLLSQRFLINNVPLKLVAREGMSDDMLSQLEGKGRDSLENWQPKDLLTHNIGSNIGLMNVLKDVLPEIGPDTPPAEVHQILNSDCQIYVRIAKVRISNSFHHLSPQHMS